MLQPQGAQISTEIVRWVGCTGICCSSSITILERHHRLLLPRGFLGRLYWKIKIQVLAPCCHSSIWTPPRLKHQGMGLLHRAPPPSIAVPAATASEEGGGAVGGVGRQEMASGGPHGVVGSDMHLHYRYSCVCDE